MVRVADPDLNLPMDLPFRAEPDPPQRRSRECVPGSREMSRIRKAKGHDPDRGPSFVCAQRIRLAISPAAATCHSERSPMRRSRVRENACRAPEESTSPRRQARSSPPRPSRRDPAPRSVRPPLFGGQAGVAHDDRHTAKAGLYRGSARCAARALVADATGLPTGLAKGASRFLGSPPGFLADAAAARRAPLGMTARIDDHDTPIYMPAGPPRTSALSRLRTSPRTSAPPSSSRPRREACRGSCSRCRTPAGRPWSCSPSTGGR